VLYLQCLWILGNLENELTEVKHVSNLKSNFDKFINELNNLDKKGVCLMMFNKLKQRDYFRNLIRQTMRDYGDK
jgi:hypothetical protein